MPLSLLLPAGLAALGALLLPLLIHLARRSEQRPTDFAALRWLRARPRPRHRLRVDERLLLTLRLLLLALLALLLAQPVLEGAADATPRVLVAPGVPLAQARLRAVPAGARWQWLAPGFPPIDAPAPTRSEAQASLLREFDALLPAAATLSVIVPERWAPLDAQLPQLSRTPRWLVVAGATSPSADPTPAAPPALLAYADDPAAGALRYLRALQAAWQSPTTPLEVRLAKNGDTPPAGITTLVWLSDAPLPAALQQWIRAGGTALLAHGTPLPAGSALAPRWRDDAGATLLDGSRLGHGQLLRFSRALEPQAMPQLLDGGFPEALRGALQPPAPPTQAFAATHVPEPGARAQPAAATPLAPWLALAIALLFLLERWLASAPRRSGR